MKYLLDDVMRERKLVIEHDKALNCVFFNIQDEENSSCANFAVDDDLLYELIGVLHHIQKQMK